MTNTEFLLVLMLLATNIISLKYKTADHYITDGKDIKIENIIYKCGVKK